MARSKRLVRSGAFIVLVFAILPSVLYVGHWSVAGLNANAVHTAAEAHEHAAHCHGDQSECSGSLFGQALLVEAAATLLLLGSTVLLTAGAPLLATAGLAGRLVPPPRLIPS